MLIALVVFLSTQGQVIRDVEAAGNDLRVASRVAKEATSSAGEPSEDKPAAGGFAGGLSRAFPGLMLVAGVGLPAYYVWRASIGQVAWTDAIMPVAFGGVAGWMALTLRQIRGAARDKSTVIFVFFLFAVLFWMAFEQAGNALSLWAQYHTDLTIGSFRYPAEWWQSVNAALIVILAPVFARVWTWLGERGKEPSTPTKMLAAMAFMALSFGAMVVGARAENDRVTSQEITSIPAAIPQVAVAGGRVALGEDAGRLTFDGARGSLEVRGVLPRYVVNDLLNRTVPKAFADEIEGLEAKTRRASASEPVTVRLESVPAGFSFPFDDAEAEDRGVRWDAANRTMTISKWVEPPTSADLAAAGAPPEWRDPLRSLEMKSDAARVSGLWLFLSYLFATLGELCLSPVGLSMVTKLAPLRFASLFMGVWLLASSVAQYAGGSIGETWGIVPPTAYFMLFVWTSVVGALVLAVLVRPLERLMHEVT
jgi:POT family proton-dependent oligopeptide transporter